MTMEGGGSGGGMRLDPNTLLAGGGIGRQVAVTAIAVILGLLVGAVLIVFANVMNGGEIDLGLPLVAFDALFQGSLSNEKAIANTLNAATPLILVGLAVSFGFRAGLFNIGAQGQFFLGAFLSALLGAMAGLPDSVHLAVTLLGGFIGGALWGFIPGLLKAWRGAHEVVTTIMLNFVAMLSLNLLAGTTFRDPGASFPRTSDILPSATLPILLQDTRLHAGIIVALLAAFAVWFLLFKTALGFEIRMVGANASAARYAGIRPGFITVLTMSISGGLAGLAGAAEILGITKNFPAEYSTTYGFDGIAVALLGRSHPFGVVGAALLFGVLRAGVGTMQRTTNIPIDIIVIVQAAIILFVAAEVLIRRALPQARARAEAEEAA